MCKNDLQNTKHLRVSIGYVLGLSFFVNPFKGESVKLEYDTEAFDVCHYKHIQADEDEQIEYYDFIAKKEGQFKVEGGLLFADGTLCLEESYLLEVARKLN